jgi:uncharacterized protein
MIYKPAQLQTDLPYEAIQSLCEKHRVVELSVFGSVLRDDFRPDSDVDFLVVFADDQDYGPWMERLTDFQEDLSEVLARKVDVVPRAGVEQSENYIRRRHILESARRIYVAG